MSVSFRHLLSPILRRWCTSTTSASTCANSCERYELNVGDEIECNNHVTSCAILNDVTIDTNDVTRDVTHDCEDSDENSSKTGTKEHREEFTDIRNVLDKESGTEKHGSSSRSSKRSCSKAKSHVITTTVFTTPKTPLSKQSSTNKVRGGNESMTTSNNTKPFSRGNSAQETLSKDEARRRMLSWRKTTKIRKSSGIEPAVTSATCSTTCSTGNGSSKRAKESSRHVRRNISAEGTTSDT